MAIIPSGNRKTMKTQKESSFQKINIGNEDSARAFIRVSQLLQEPEDDLAVDTNNPEEQMLDDYPDQTDQTDQLTQNVKGDFSDNSLRKFVFKMLEDLGVPPRTLDAASEKVFKSTEDLASGTVSGFYMIPTYTVKGEISEKEAKGIAQKIGSQFGLIQKLESNGSNYKISFQSGANDVNKEEESSGTSFDNLLSGGGKESSAPKSAATLREMLKEGRSHLFNKLTEQ